MWWSLITLGGVGGAIAYALYKLGIIGEEHADPKPQSLAPEGRKIDDKLIKDALKKQQVDQAVKATTSKLTIPSEITDEAEAKRRTAEWLKANEKLRKEVEESNRKFEAEREADRKEAEELKARMESYRPAADRVNADLR